MVNLGNSRIELLKRLRLRMLNPLINEKRCTMSEDIYMIQYIIFPIQWVPGAVSSGLNLLGLHLM
jgi:hypothetical protein